MILCIDSGNTRVKWAVRDGEVWRFPGAARQDDPGLAALARLPEPDIIKIANVAGEIAAKRLLEHLPWKDRIVWAASTSRCCGVTNGYAAPGQLGVDRWYALVGAWRLTASACLIVGAGTATTIDALDTRGRFQGGLILPGLELMHASLAHNTADLPLAQGRHLAWPDNTADAIASGCLEAQLGAIERAFERLGGETAGVACLLFGGAAPRLAEKLSLPHRMEDKLVLEGLASDAEREM